MMENTAINVNARIAARVRALRAARGLTLDGLAERSGVSRSMISLVERGESSPTAVVLDRIAAGLGVTLASLFEAPEAARSPLARRADQAAWQDPATGYVRRNLSPPGFPSALELVEVSFPPGGRIAYETASRGVAIDQQIWMLDGVIELTGGAQTYRLEAGDCLAMRLDRPTVFFNPTDRPARYVLALATHERRGGGNPGGPLD